MFWCDVNIKKIILNILIQTVCGSIEKEACLCAIVLRHWIWLMWQLATTERAELDTLTVVVITNNENSS